MLSCVFFKYGVCLEIDCPISDLPPKEQGEFLIIDRYPVVVESSMFERGMHFYVFYCLCYVKNISMNMLEEHVLEEIYPYLDDEEDIIMTDSREYHWRDFAEYGKDKSNMNALRWDFYKKEEEDLIKREFSVTVLHLGNR